MPNREPSFKTCSLRLKSNNGPVLVLDVGTTGVKAFIFAGDGNIIAKAYREINKTRPQAGWVEQDPQEILTSAISVMQQALQKSGVVPTNIAGFGLTNQREATVVWNKQTGQAIYPIIGWEDTRTQEFCHNLQTQNGQRLRELTGLPVASYFSASKINWILNNVPTAREQANRGELACGTIDSWLLYHLCSGNPHLTDETNASRTLLFNLHTKQWDETLTKQFDIPLSILPQVLLSRAKFGVLKPEVIAGDIPVLAVCGDQQASLYAASQTVEAISPITKITYGTGSFIMQNIGQQFQLDDNFFTTLTPSSDNKGSDFALETKIEGSGEAVASVLKNPVALNEYLTTLAKQINTKLKLLPTTPKLIIADGGAARDGIIIELQQNISNIPVYLEQTYDGTALGVALLICKSL
jgi:glycerol kinase